MQDNKTGKKTISRKVKHIIWILSFLTSVIALLCFLRYGLVHEGKSWSGIWLWIKKTNLNFYFTLLLVFFGSFMISRFVYFHIIKEPKFDLTLKHPILGKIVASIIVAGVVILLLNWLFIQEYFEFPSRAAQRSPITNIPLGYIIVITVTGAALAIWAIRERKDCASFLVKYVYVLCVALTFWGLYFPNIFVADFHHGIAAIESIFNVADLTPFIYDTTGIYGHYSIFFYVPLKLLGCDIETVVALIALCGCIACTCILYVIHNLMPLNWMRIMAALASVFNIVIMRISNYWQVQPIRILFPAIFMAYAVYLCKKKMMSPPEGENHTSGYSKLRAVSVKKCAVPWFLGVLAVLWNTESGIFCLLAFVAFLVTDYWQTYKWYEKKMWYIYASSVVFVISAIIGSVAALNIYNLICGGPLVFSTFFYPLQVEQYMTDALEYDLVFGNHVWIYVLILFFLLLCWGLYHTQWFCKNNQDHTWSMAPSAVLTASLGLLSFSYYANRAAYSNLDICFPMAICANAFIIGGLWPQFVGRKIISFDISCKKACVIICLLVIFGLSIQLLYAPIVMKDRYESGSQSTIALRTEVAQLRKIIPENTYGVGYGISIIYHILGWDNYAHYRDVSDLRIDGKGTLNKIVKSILEQDSFLCSTYTSRSTAIIQGVLSADPYYQLEATITIQGRDYQYYVRNSSD